MSITENPDDPQLREIEADGQQKSYLVLSEEERKKGFVRPVRFTYTHVGLRPKNLRDLTPEEQKQYGGHGYVAYEKYDPAEGKAAVGRFFTREMLSPCGATTKMHSSIAETYARDPKFYGATWCVGCKTHRPVAEFEWDDGTVVGS